MKKIMNRIIVNETKVGLRIDTFLAEIIKDKSRSYIQKAIENGQILVNDKLTKASYKVNLNDVITYNELETKELDIVASDIPLNIIYEDDDVIVINKQRGLVVHPSNGHYDGDTLVNALMYHKENLSSINGVVRPGIVHRIDKDTSGLLVVAKNDEAHLFLADQLKDKTMHREYYALVHGVIPHTDLIIKAPLGKDKKDRLKMAVDPINGKEAITHVHVVERYKNATLVTCKLETGRTHQIRVHLSYIKYPIVGDIVYGRKSTFYTSKGQMLHAYKLSFVHPRTKENITFTCDVDDEFKRVQEILKNE